MKYVWLWILGVLALYMSIYSVIEFIKAYRKVSKSYGKKLIWPHKAFDEMSYASIVWIVIVVVLAFFISLMTFGGVFNKEEVKDTKTTVESTTDELSADVVGIDLINNE